MLTADEGLARDPEISRQLADPHETTRVTGSDAAIAGAATLAAQVAASMIPNAREYD
jgi:hypothetical protein